MEPEEQSFSAASVVEDVLQQHGPRLNDVMASRRAEQAAIRRHEAASWLRRTVGAVAARNLPEAPSEDEFRLGLRSGYILCNAVNKVQPGAIPRVVECPGDSAVLPEGTPLSSYQYFENMRNFLDSAQEIGLPLFEASDLEKGGQSARVVNCVLALKSYSEWKQYGGKGSWKYGGNLKPISSGKFVVRKNSELFVNSLSRNLSINEKLQDALSSDQSLTGISQQSSEMVMTHSWIMLLREALAGRKPEEVPILVESILSKVMEEFERRTTSQIEVIKPISNDLSDNKSSPRRKFLTELPLDDLKMDIVDENSTQFEEEPLNAKLIEEESIYKFEKQRSILERQQKDIQELKHILYTTRTGMQFMQMKYSEEFFNLGKHLQSLASAASGYHKILEENRRLYNQVQDLKGSIRVYCRVRPFLPGQPCHLSTIGRIDDGSITIMTPSKYGKEGRKSFNFNKVFGPSATQDEVFLDTQPLIRSVLDGYNVCIFAYGQTGSGKTYTMSGPKEISKQSQGVNYRALGDLFYLSEQRRGTCSYDIAVQMIEIYNEQVRDLLSGDGVNRRLEIRNSSQNGLNVPDANLVPVSSTSDVIELMNIGQRNRAVCSTAMNDRSSRSHSCLTVHVQGRELTSGTTLRGCMHLVDLAGSERVDKSEVTGDRLKEAQHINKSLSALGDVIAALAQKNAHVPYRNSKLTQLLQDSLGGQAKTLMFVHISPESDAVGETISTLKFAERVSTVELGAARLNKENPEVKELKEQIACLKEALAKKDEESEEVCNVMPSPDRIQCSAPSSLNANRQRGGNVLGGQTRQPMEDVGNIETWCNSSLRQKKLPTPPTPPTFDVKDLLMPIESPLWPDSSVKGGEKEEASYNDWVDKVIVNKQEIKDDNLIKDWQSEAPQLPEFFYQRYIPDMRVYPDQHHLSRNESMEFDMNRMRAGSVTTDDSDDFDRVTSDSSEADLLWQFTQQTKVTAVVSGSGSRIKKPQSRSAKNGSPDIRTPPQQPPRGLSPSLRKATSGAMRSGNGKRHSLGGKVGSGK